jgi:hypothetical protein
VAASPVVPHFLAVAQRLGARASSSRSDNGQKLDDENRCALDACRYDRPVSLDGDEGVYRRQRQGGSLARRMPPAAVARRHRSGPFAPARINLTKPLR